MMLAISGLQVLQLGAFAIKMRPMNMVQHEGLRRLIDEFSNGIRDTRGKPLRDSKDYLETFGEKDAERFTEAVRVLHNVDVQRDYAKCDAARRSLQDMKDALRERSDKNFRLWKGLLELVDESCSSGSPEYCDALRQDLFDVQQKGPLEPPKAYWAPFAKVPNPTDAAAARLLDTLKKTAYRSIFVDGYELEDCVDALSPISLEGEETKKETAPPEAVLADLLGMGFVRSDIVRAQRRIPQARDLASSTTHWVDAILAQQAADVKEATEWVWAVTNPTAFETKKPSQPWLTKPGYIKILGFGHGWRFGYSDRKQQGRLRSWILTLRNERVRSAADSNNPNRTESLTTEFFEKCHHEEFRAIALELEMARVDEANRQRPEFQEWQEEILRQRRMKKRNWE